MKKAIHILAVISLIMSIVSVVTLFFYAILAFGSSASIVTIVMKTMEASGTDTTGLEEALFFYVSLFGIFALIVAIMGSIGIVFNAIILSITKKDEFSKASFITWGILSIIFASQPVSEVMGVLMIIEGARHGK